MRSRSRRPHRLSRPCSRTVGELPVDAHIRRVADSRQDDGVGRKVEQLVEVCLLLQHRFLCALARGDVQDKGDAMLHFVIERSPADKHRNPAAILAEKLLLKGRQRPVDLSCVGNKLLKIAVEPFGWRQIAPPQPTRDQVFTLVADDAEKCVVGFENPPPRSQMKIPTILASTSRRISASRC